jgi:dGTPase
LRALAIGSLISDAVKVLLKMKPLFCKENSYALMEKSKYKAQMDDIIKISVEKSIKVAR